MTIWSIKTAARPFCRGKLTKHANHGMRQDAVHKVGAGSKER